jgi:hypothetical protein
MFRRRKTLTCPGGQWTTVIQSQFAQMPASWTVRLQGNGNASMGQYEETKSAWVFPGTPSVGALDVEMAFDRGYWNTFYKVRFCPVETITITIE